MLFSFLALLFKFPEETIASMKFYDCFDFIIEDIISEFEEFCNPASDEVDLEEESKLIILGLSNCLHTELGSKILKFLIKVMISCYLARGEYNEEYTLNADQKEYLLKQIDIANWGKVLKEI